MNSGESFVQLRTEVKVENAPEKQRRSQLTGNAPANAAHQRGEPAVPCRVILGQSIRFPCGRVDRYDS